MISRACELSIPFVIQSGRNWLSVQCLNLLVARVSRVGTNKVKIVQGQDNARGKLSSVCTVSGQAFEVSCPVEQSKQSGSPGKSVGITQHSIKGRGSDKMTAVGGGHAKLGVGS